MGKFGEYLWGGATTSMAGDGYGGAPPAKSLELPKSPTSSALRPGDYITSDEPGPSTPSKPFNPSPIHTDFANDFANDIPQQPDSQRIPPKSTHSANGIRAPRSSLAPPPAVTAPTHSTRPSIESFRTASEEPSINPAPPMPEWREEAPWEDYEIPQELEFMKDDMPQDIRNIIRESMDEHRAMRASRMQAQTMSASANEVLDTLYTSDQPVIAESSSDVSARSLPISKYSTSNLSIPSMSDTSVESNVERGGRLKPPTNQLYQPTKTSSQESLPTKEKPSQIMTDLERKFQESKSRTHKSHTLFRLLPHRRSKGQPSPEIRRVETTTSECTGCLDDFPDTKAIGLPCHHKYCSPCFSQLVSTSIQNEASYPPKCCLTEIPKRTIRNNLPPLICAQFEKKALEHAVPVGNRYYCVSPKCAKWIDTRHVRRTNGAIKCPHCATKLCTLCRGPQHPSNEDCPQDFGLGRTLEQAERAGWRRCYNCRAMVELNAGCRHITCNCRAEFCYTCGAVWRTCRCTEGDQALRDRDIRTRLAQFEADQRAEEEEMRAAMEAVETAERLLREEREAEERRIEEEAVELQRQEAERLQKIADWYEYLRGVLQRVRLQQTLAIEKRHDLEWDAIDRMRDDLDSVVKAAEREAQVKSDRAKIIASTETVIKSLQRQHAASMMETLTRHRKDQDDLFASSAESEDPDAEVRLAETLQELMLAQDLERTTLKSQQARDVQKWKQRGEASLQSFDSRAIALKTRLEEAVIINKREREVRLIIFADGKWSETLFEERLAMLAEDEQQLIRKGGEAPDAPKRDTVVLPENWEETLALQRPTRSHREAPVAPQPQSEGVLLHTQRSALEVHALQQPTQPHSEASVAPQPQSGRNAPHTQRSASQVQALQQPTQSHGETLVAPQPVPHTQGSANKIQELGHDSTTQGPNKEKLLQAKQPLTAEKRKELDAMMNWKADKWGDEWATIVHA